MCIGRLQGTHLEAMSSDRHYEGRWPLIVSVKRGALQIRVDGVLLLCSLDV